MKKGFTLIELLAVIVVLAVIALIAIPLITNVIATSKKESAVDSVYGYVDAIEKNVALGQLDSSKGIIVPSNSVISMEDAAQAETLENMKVKGTKPDYAEITFSGKKVSTAVFCMDGYNIKYENKKASVVSEDYCANAKVKEVNVKNPEIVFDGNNGEATYSPGQTIGLDIEVITVDNSPFDNIEIQDDVNNNTVSVDGTEISINSMGVETVVVKAGIRFKRITITVANDSILGYLEAHDFASDCAGLYDENGMCDIAEKTITANGQTYLAHIYNYNQDLEISGTVAYGVADDVASGTATANMAKRMVVLKVNGNLTINSGGILRPHYNSSYGGPKGFVIYVTGTITNNGTIDNSHGAYATGQAVHLWQNSDTSTREFETVPATGGNGATKRKFSDSASAGTAGSPGSGRSTGGGGGGSGYSSSTSYADVGGTGSSYSGGTGSGSVYGCNSGSGTSGKGSSAGGSGGAGWSNGSSCVIVGGAGNPNPGISKTASGDSKTNGANGSGGLLVIYGYKVINNTTNSKITANGAAAGVVTHSSRKYSGGSSGGGSINIFYRSEYTTPTTLTASGGVRANGGSGGNGTVTVGSIATGTFVAG